MIKEHFDKEAVRALKELELIEDNWGEKTLDIIFDNRNKFDGDFDDFLDNCIACGGDWNGMILSGLQKLFPEVYEAIPNDMGVNSWDCLCATINLLGIKTK